MKGVKIGREHNCLTALMGVLGEWGYQALFFDQLDQARDCFAESLQIAQENNHQVSIAVRLADLGEVARREKQFRQAEHYFKQAIVIAEQEQFTTWLPIIQIRYGALLFAHGKQKKGVKLFCIGWENRALMHKAYERELELFAIMAKQANIRQI
jgi:tetratricopeptide (TPR) repeat protein